MFPQAQRVIRDYEHGIARVILYCISETPIRLGVGRIIGILRGTKSAFVIERELHKLATYGILPTFTTGYLKAVIEVLVKQGLLAVEMVSDYENLPILKITATGQEFLSGNIGMNISFAENLADKEVIELTETEKVLYEALRQIRLKIAIARGLPAYTICHDRILREMARSKPMTPDTLLAIHGVGEKFIQNYGEYFLEAIKPHVV